MDQLPGDEVVDDSILWILSHSSDCKESYLTYDGPELYEEVYKMLQISHSLEMELLIHEWTDDSFCRYFGISADKQAYIEQVMKEYKIR